MLRPPPFVVFIVAVVLASLPVAAAVVTFAVTGQGESGVVRLRQGDLLEVQTALSADAGLAVGGVEYTLCFPDLTWLLASRDYADANWIGQDGLYDNSMPLAGSIDEPVPITPLLYSETPLAADIAMNTVRVYGEGAVGYALMESLQVCIPLTTLPGDYTVAFDLAYAYDEYGTPLQVVAGAPLIVTVSEIPEPTAAVLLAAAAAVFAGRRSRRARGKTGRPARGGDGPRLQTRAAAVQSRR